ncbi:MAG TPA: SMC family ATPase [Frankiaceae bacterium]|nr:SMC family ATPase [Frankiaceae bacterium]
MRPITLVAEGFTAFRERVDIDFEDVGFFALVGPTGAGKSSVIDAMCFALYGFVPRYDNKNKVADAVTLGASQARVQLVFEVGGRRFTLTRVVRRTKAGGATTKECRLERHLDTDTTEVIAGDADAATAAVTSLLGLSRDDFVRCVVLPQGQFAEFLHDKPSDRQDFLVRLLDLGIYSRMASLARQRAAEADVRRDSLSTRLTELEYATAQAERDAAEAVTGLASLRERLDTAQPHVERLQADARDARRLVDEQVEAVERFAKATSPPNLADLAPAVTTAKARIDGAVAETEAAEALAEVAEALAADAPDGQLLRRIIETYAELDELTDRIEMTADDLTRAAETSRTKRNELEKAAADLDAAEAAVRDLDHRHAAYTISQTLTVGAPCPVCAQPVSVLPGLAEPAELTPLTEKRDRAAAARRDSEKQSRTADKAEEALRATAAELQRQHEQLRARITDERSLDDITAEIERIEGLHLDARTKRAAAKTAQSKVLVARRQLAAFDDELTAARATYTQQRDTLAAFKPPQPTDDIVTDWAALATWLDEQRPVAEAELRKRQDRQAAAAAEVTRFVAALQEDCREHGVSLPGTVTYEALCRATDVAHTKAQSAHEEIRKDRKRARALNKEIDTLAERATVAKEVGRLLSAKQFESWVLTEALDDLVVGASETLRRLSDGAYSLTLTERNDFVVIDHREADAERSVKTLSGGETFQAALALALSLADNLSSYAAAGANRLESIFLDEGFGTLDETCLDIVATTLEALASSERMVGIVTHVRELADRVPIRYEVRRTGRTATVERVTA